jgi:hypothetical protein
MILKRIFLQFIYKLPLAEANGNRVLNYNTLLHTLLCPLSKKLHLKQSLMLY